MKLSLLCLLALVALLSASLVSASQREVRSYTNDMEYVDHVDVNAAAQESPAADHAMIQTESSDSAPAADETHYSMESEAEAQAEEEFGIHDSFIEADAATEIDTEVMRAMALEIHDFAQANLDEDGEVTMMVEMDSEAEAEAEADPSGLSAAELADEKADKIAEEKAKAAEAADKAEETQEKKEAAADEKIIQAAVTSGAISKADVAAASKPAAAAPAVTKDIVTLPPDLSAEHAETIRVNEAATRTIKGALNEMGGILASKDDTIRSLVYNISYLTVNIGKLANKVDLQKSYINLLRNKLHLANLKNKELHDHVEHSADTVVTIRQQLKAVEDRLNKQDKTTAVLSDFLTKNQDKIELPALADDLEIRGTPVVPGNARLARRVRTAINSRFRPVEGTQVYADAHAAFIPATNAGPAFYPSQYYVPTPASAPTYFPQGLDIPTIIVEREDNGQ